MAEFSKYFYEAVKNCSCADIIHDPLSTGCLDTIVRNFTETIFGCAKYTAPVFFVNLFKKLSYLFFHSLYLLAVIGGNENT